MAGQKNINLQFSYCHQKPERSFFWKGRKFPVCARCTGIQLGYITLPIFLFSVWTLNFWWTIALILPTYVDGWSQAYLNRNSNNTFRLLTGLLAGVGIMSLTSIIGKKIGELILYFIH